MSDTTLDTTETIEVVEATFSPYQAAKKVNELLVENEVDKQLPPQMFYTYTKKGYIKAFRNDENKILVREADLLEWFGKYLEKQRTLAEQKANAAALATNTASESK